MIPQYSNLYEELPDDIFHNFRNVLPVKERTVISSFSAKILLEYEIIEQFKIIAAWCNAQGLLGNLVKDIKFENPIFSENAFSGTITVTCEVTKKTLGYIGKEMGL